METRRLPQHKTYWLERLALKTVSRLVRTDGSLLLVVRIAQIQHERHNAGDGTQGSKDSQQCRSYMYRLPRDEFPVRANTRLHSALTGWQATVFYRAPSTKEEKTRLGRWASTTFIIQANRQMSNKFAFCRNTGLCVKCPMRTLTFLADRAIIKTQGDARANRHLPVVETRRLPHNIHT